MTDKGPGKKKLIIPLTIIVVLLILHYVLPASALVANGFVKYVFLPFQYLRNVLFGHIPISIGDILYLGLTVYLIVLLAKWIYFLLNFKKYRRSLSLSLLRAFTAASVIYLWFFLGWGENYYQPSLSMSWQLNDSSIRNDSVLYAFDGYLVNKLNSYAPYYRALSFSETGRRAAGYYRYYTDLPSKLSGLRVKPSLFGNMLEFMGVQGYYDPFTGEAQVNSYLPHFLLPFVVCHELAHQSGIAAEDDANLLAYTIGTATNDTAFIYSCYFNLWLYTHSKLKMHDTASAKQLYKTLNAITISQIDTLRAINKRYRSKLSHYTNGWYDSYLRFNHVKDGIDSYDDVVQSAYAWERLRIKRKDSLIHIP